MKVVGKTKVLEFKRKHPKSRKPLDRWMQLVEASDFPTPVSVKRVFGGNVDFVDDLTVFDVGGNNYRIITAVTHEIRLIQVRDVLTHAEYSREGWKTR